MVAPVIRFSGSKSELKGRPEDLIDGWTIRR